MSLENKVNTEKLKPLLDDILELSNWQAHPYIVYEFIENETGVDRTTIYRYYTHKIKKAPRKLYNYLAKLKKKLEDNKLTIKSRSGFEKKIDVDEVAPLFDAIFKLSSHPAYVYDFIAAETKVHPNTVKNYVYQRIKKVPPKFKEYLTELKQRLENGLIIKPKSNNGYLVANELVDAYNKVLAAYDIKPESVQTLNKIICKNCNIERTFAFKEKLKNNETKRVTRTDVFRFLKYLVEGDLQRSTERYYKLNDLLKEKSNLGIVTKSTDEHYTVKFLSGTEKTYVQMCFNGGRLAGQHFDFSDFPDM